ncbi:nucleotide exchange factor GrpE [candidate division KSB3 bacterium]|uniref:Protein GrpE n=1 Tax=candidate division KSB3 bacterium TaxID=2044937 RepID=A0A9D5Q8F6_9BACT|nr:nucleotide exchange factor GrpE [candidate division KSB3 bacterium]MBD3326836.1 nucleotide exchange factor GrpE [candidate division KSB3 bacterium]
MVKIPVQTPKEEEPQDTTETQQEHAQQETAPQTANKTTAEPVEPETEPPTPATTDAEEPVEAAAAEDVTEALNEDDEVIRLRQQLEAKEQEVKEQYEARLRLQAELDNFKKRKEKEILEFRKYANESFIRELLTVRDDFERAIAAAEQTHKLEDFLKGVEMIAEKFMAILRKKGVKEIEAEGQPFNPEIHEAVTQIETNEVEEGAIASVFQKGYYLHDRVLIAPKVAVAKKPASEA